jgi:hypothetical protein
LNASDFPGPQLPIGEAYALPGGEHARLIWDTAQRRLALQGDYLRAQTLIEFEPGTWNRLRSVRAIDGAIVGNPDTGPFALQWISPWQGASGATMFYEKDLSPLPGGFGWVSDIAAWGALASNAANPDLDTTNNHEAVGILRFDPKTSKVSWFRKDLQPPARWIGRDVLVPHGKDWLVLNGMTGQTLCHQPMAEDARLMLLDGMDLVVSRWSPATIEIWRVRGVRGP